MRVTILTISDRVSRGEREDKSGPALVERCKSLGWEIVATETLPDERATIASRLTTLADSAAADLVLTTGGTGIGPRDSTPEATVAVCERLLPGFGELMRAKGREFNPRAILSARRGRRTREMSDRESSRQPQGRRRIARRRRRSPAARRRCPPRRTPRLSPHSR